MVGAVTSTLRCMIEVEALLPALSIALPGSVWLAPSPTSTGAVQLATPERLSPQVNVTVGLPVLMLYQPVGAGETGAMLALIVGGVLSMLMLLTVALELLPATSVQLVLRDWSVPSAETTCGVTG